MARVRKQMQLKFNWGMSLEEADLFTRAHAGDRQAVDMLMSKHKGLVYSALRSMGIYDPEHRERAESSGLTGLWQAILRYEPGSGYRFSTYAVRYIRGYIFRYGKAFGQRLQQIPLPVDSEGDEVDLAEVIEDYRETLPDVQAEKAEITLAEVLRKARAVRLISSREAVVLEMRGKGHILDRIAERLGCTRARVQQMEARAIERIRTKTVRTWPVAQ